MHNSFTRSLLCFSLFEFVQIMSTPYHLRVSHRQRDVPFTETSQGP